MINISSHTSSIPVGPPPTTTEMRDHVSLITTDPLAVATGSPICNSLSISDSVPGFSDSTAADSMPEVKKTKTVRIMSDQCIS